MSLKLPFFPDLRRTLLAWATELRGSGVVTVGRPNGPAIPYLPSGSQTWEQRTLGNAGESWTNFTTVSNSAGLTLTKINTCKYVKLAKGIFYQIDFKTTKVGAGFGVIAQFQLPFTHRLLIRTGTNYTLNVGAGYAVCSAFANADTALGISVTRLSGKDYLSFTFPGSWSPWVGGEVIDLGAQFFIEAE